MMYMCTCAFKHSFLHDPVLNSNSNSNFKRFFSQYPMKIHSSFFTCSSLFSEIAYHNERAGEAFQKTSGGLFSRQEELLSSQADLRARSDADLAERREAAVLAADKLVRKVTEEARKADENTIKVRQCRESVSLKFQSRLFLLLIVSAFVRSREKVL